MKKKKIDSNIFLDNSVYEQIKNMKFDIELLFKAMIETATLNPKYSNKFFQVFANLKELNILDNDENRIIDIMLEHYSLSNGAFPSLTFLKQTYEYSTLEAKYYDDDIRIKTLVRYPSQVGIVAEEFIKIKQRRCFLEKNKETLKKISKNSSIPLDFIYELEDYRNNAIPFNENSISKPFIYEMDKDDCIGIDTTLDFLVPRFRYLKYGSLNCLVKNKFADNCLELSILYNTLINEHKNVCYISTNWSSSNILKKLLVLHSLTLSEDLILNYEKLLSNEENIEKVNAVLSDFENKSNNKLQIFDNTSLYSFNIDTLRKLLLGVNFKFKNNSNKGIELLIIDTIEDLRLENKGMIEDNKQKVVKTYANFIIRQSKLCFREDFEEMTVLISTHTCQKSTSNYFKTTELNNTYDKDIEITNSVLEKYADTVTVFALEKKETEKQENEPKEENQNGFIQIIKNLYNNAMDEIITVTVSQKDCKIVKRNEDNSDNDYSQPTTEEVMNSETKQSIKNVNMALKNCGIT